MRTYLGEVNIVLRHPGRHELLAYAASQVDGDAISARIARHVARCHACTAEVAAIRASLQFVKGAPSLEPNPAFAAQILSAARQVRHSESRYRPFRSMVSLAKGLALAAAVLVIGIVGFHTAFAPDTVVSRVRVVQQVQPSTNEGPTPEEIRKASLDVQTLAAAVRMPTEGELSLVEWQHRREAMALGADLAAAKAALERFPGFDRANRVVTFNLPRQAQTLKKLIVERPLSDQST